MEERLEGKRRSSGSQWLTGIGFSLTFVVGTSDLAIRGLEAIALGNTLVLGFNLLALDLPSIRIPAWSPIGYLTLLAAFELAIRYHLAVVLNFTLSDRFALIIALCKCRREY